MSKVEVRIDLRTILQDQINPKNFKTVEDFCKELGPVRGSQPPLRYVYDSQTRITLILKC